MVAWSRDKEVGLAELPCQQRYYTIVWEYLPAAKETVFVPCLISIFFGMCQESQQYPPK
jgi:hypothetical protein